MQDHLTTPLALAMTAVLLLCISLIPARPPVRPPVADRQPAHASLPAWVASLPLEDESDRLAVLVAVRLSALALDAVVASNADPASEAIPAAPEPARRQPKSARRLTPFYSFASQPPRPQGA